MYIAHRIGRAYLVMSDSDWSEPRLINSFYPINVDRELLPQDTRVERDSIPGVYAARLEFETRRFNLASPCPEFTEFEPIKQPSPKHTWRNGEWKK